MMNQKFLGVLITASLIILSVVLFSGKSRIDGSLHTLNVNMDLHEKPASPNIFLFLMDDLGWNDIGYHSSDLSELTPTIDSLAKDGVKLTKHYSMPVCTPSRASLLTGKHPIQLGMQHSQILPAAPWGMPLTEKILPEYLKKSGYTSHIIGKWHLGHYKDEYLPHNRGFDSFYGFTSPGIHYREHYVVDSCQSLDDDDDMCAHDFFINGEFIGSNDRVRNSFSTEIFRDESVFIINEHDVSDPLLMYIPLQNVHSPLTTNDECYNENPELFEDIPNSNRQTYAVLVKMMDDAIDTIMTATKENGLYDNSVFIFISDNGGDPEKGANNYPLRGLKKTLFEGGVRTHAFVHSPLIPESRRGSTYEELFHISDWVPTILKGILGFDIADSDDGSGFYGVNQWEALIGESDEVPRDEVLLNIDYLSTDGSVLDEPDASLIYKDYKVIINERGVKWYDVPDDDEDVEVTKTGRKSYLFNLDKDPNEEVNLWDMDKFSEIKENLNAKLKYYYKNWSRPCRYVKEINDKAWSVWVKQDLYAMVPFMNDVGDSDIQQDMYTKDKNRWQHDMNMFGGSEDADTFV